MESKLLKVPIVQELAKEKLSTVPPRYIRPDHDPFVPSRRPEIPVIDLQNLFDPNLMDSELHKLHSACQEWSFFQLINHGVNSSAIETMKLETQEFFNLPVEEKKATGRPSLYQKTKSFDWADLFYVTTLPAYLREPHLIPNLPTEFRNAIEAYADELRLLAMKLLKQMAKALGMKYEEMETLLEDGMQTMRMNYYPPCPQPELVTGLCPHSDAAGLTILLQVNEIEGLQIKKDGAWIPAKFKRI